MQRSDAYFVGCLVGYLLMVVLNGFWLKLMHGDVVQMGFVLMLLLPLVCPPLGVWVGVEPLWSSWRNTVNMSPRIPLARRVGSPKGCPKA